VVLALAIEQQLDEKREDQAREEGLLSEVIDDFAFNGGDGIILGSKKAIHKKTTVTGQAVTAKQRSNHQPCQIALTFSRSSIPFKSLEQGSTPAQLSSSCGSIFGFYLA
jgi:hypothetical protein